MLTKTNLKLYDLTNCSPVALLVGREGTDETVLHFQMPHFPTVAILAQGSRQVVLQLTLASRISSSVLCDAAAGDQQTTVEDTISGGPRQEGFGS